MANFIDEEDHPVKSGLGFSDGFRFGFGWFMAHLLAFIIIVGVAILVIHLSGARINLHG